MNNESNEINEYDFCMNINEERLIYDGSNMFNFITGKKININKENNIYNNEENIIEKFNIIEENIEENIKNNTLPKEDSKIFYENTIHNIFPYSLFLDSYFSCSNCFIYIINRIKCLYGCITSIIKEPPNIISVENSNKNEN